VSDELHQVAIDDLNGLPRRRHADARFELGRRAVQFKAIPASHTSIAALPESAKAESRAMTGIRAALLNSVMAGTTP